MNLGPPTPTAVKNAWGDAFLCLLATAPRPVRDRVCVLLASLLGGGVDREKDLLGEL